MNSLIEFWLWTSGFLATPPTEVYEMSTKCLIKLSFQLQIKQYYPDLDHLVFQLFELIFRIICVSTIFQISPFVLSSLRQLSSQFLEHLSLRTPGQLTTVRPQGSRDLHP